MLGCLTSDLAHHSHDWQSNIKWPNYMGPCTLEGDPELAPSPAPALGLVVMGIWGGLFLSSPNSAIGEKKCYNKAQTFMEEESLNT